MADMTVGNTILRQLAGRMPLKAMLGTKYILGGPDSLTFDFPNAKNTWKCRITLTPADDYTMEFYRRHKTRGFEKVEEVERLHAEDLTAAFERYTGLYLHL